MIDAISTVAVVSRSSNPASPAFNFGICSRGRSLDRDHPDKGAFGRPWRLLRKLTKRKFYEECQGQA